jgi:hypothetical protein
MMQIKKSIEFKSGEYGGQSAGIQNSANSPLGGFDSIGQRRIRQKPYLLSAYVPLDPADHMLSQKLLVDVGVNMFACEKRYRQRKSAAQSARIAFFCSMAIT